MNEGDWVEGSPKWWWKYVMPAEDVFWESILAQRAGPSPEPWLRATAEALEAVAMLRATARVSDTGVRTRLQSEAAAKLQGASQRVAGQRAVGA